MVSKTIHLLFFVSFIAVIYGNVQELTDIDFDARLKEKKALVKFYSPNCGHCKRLEPAYKSLASLPTITSSGVLIARVDCTDKGAKTCQRYQVRGFPTVKFISRTSLPETTLEYEGNRDLHDMEEFVLENVRSPITEVTDDNLEKFTNSTTLPVVVGFFKDSNSKMLETLSVLAQENRKDFIFGYTLSKSAAERCNLEQESVVIYRQQQLKSPLEEPFVSTKQEKSLKQFLTEHRVSLVEIRNSKNEDKIPLPHVTVFIPLNPVLQKANFRRLRNHVVKVAKDFSDVTFTISDPESYEQQLSDMVPERTPKDIVMVAFDKNGNKYLCKDTVSMDEHKSLTEKLAKFVGDFKNGEVEKFVKSQKPPVSDEGHVKTVVATTFDEIVMDNEKDALIEFYAPWCGHCKKLEPIYEELAKKLKDSDKIVISKMDATANDIPSSFNVEGFPTIYLAKAGKKSDPIQYSGARDVSSMLSWLKLHATHPLKYTDEEPDKKVDL